MVHLFFKLSLVCVLSSLIVGVNGSGYGGKEKGRSGYYDPDDFFRSDSYKEESMDYEHYQPNDYKPYLPNDYKRYQPNDYTFNNAVSAYTETDRKKKYEYDGKKKYEYDGVKKEKTCVGTNGRLKGVTGTCQLSADCAGNSEANDRCLDGTECCLAVPCKVPSGQIGKCIDEDVCAFGQYGIATPNLCPGTGIKCCVETPTPCYATGAEGPAGICVNNAPDTCAGIVTAGLCPGPNHMCCTVAKCQLTDGTLGKCIQSDFCNGVSTGGICSDPGGTGVECCTEPNFGGHSLKKGYQKNKYETRGNKYNEYENNDYRGKRGY